MVDISLFCVLYWYEKVIKMVLKNKIKSLWLISLNWEVEISWHNVCKATHVVLSLCLYSGGRNYFFFFLHVAEFLNYDRTMSREAIFDYKGNNDIMFVQNMHSLFDFLFYWIS